MSEKMREEFESWAISCHMCTYLDGVEYRHQSTEWAWKAWQAWQASRAALVVELPEKAALMRASSVYAALDNAGVGYK